MTSELQTINNVGPAVTRKLERAFPATFETMIAAAEDSPANDAIEDTIEAIEDQSELLREAAELLDVKVGFEG